MNRKNWLVAIAVTMAVCFAQAQSTAAVTTEVRGTVQQWAPGASVVQVGGQTYSLAKDVQVIDRNAALVTNNAVRSGLPVQLLMFQGVVTHVVVNPGTGTTMDMPQR